MSYSYVPRTYDEYVAKYDLVPKDTLSYLRRFKPKAARHLELVQLSPRDLAARLRQAGQAAAASSPKPQRGAAPARCESSSRAVRVAAAVTEARSGLGSSPGILAGYAAMFNRPSVPLPFIEVLAPGAFRSSLARVREGDHDILAFTEHDRRNLLGRLTAGNLTLAEDERGLRFTLELPDTQLGRDTRELVQRGILRGMSFSFAVKKESWGKTEAGHPRRTVQDMLLYEVSMVATPAYPSTSVVAARSVADSVAWTIATLKAATARPAPTARRSVITGRPGQIEHR
jgi:HK97 family phage prohead protease